MTADMTKLSLLLCLILTTACSTMAVDIQQQPLSYESRLDQRALSDIDLVVIHCTELPDLATAREYGEQIHYQGSQTGNSGHFYIDRDGSIHQWVSPEYVAHHTRGYNPRSIGIELVNLGRYPNWHDSNNQQMAEEYTEEQIESLIQLLNQLSEDIPTLKWIAGHENLDKDTMPASDNPEIQIRRKLDPGPLFPWEWVLYNLGFERFAAE